MSRLYIILAIFTVALTASAQTDGIAPETIRPVTAAYTLGIGNCRLTDTYLTPLKYCGWSASLRYERWQAAKFNPDNWLMQLNAALDVSRGSNPSRNASMWNGSVGMTWGLIHRWRLPYNLTVGTGGVIDIVAGCLYNRRNSNNPASAKGAVTLDATAYISWSGRVLETPVTLRYQPTLPVTGAFFSPEYDQLYYEIYLGNRSGLVHPAWWGNYFRMENLVTVDFRVSNSAIRIGYRSGIMSTKINNITTNIATNQLIIGVSGEWISLSPVKGVSRDARIISAYY